LAYRLEFAERAITDVTETYRFVATTHSAADAERWLVSIQRRLQALKLSPESYEVLFSPPETQLTYRRFRTGSHLAIYHFDGDCVTIVRLFHVARRPISAEEL